MEPDFELPPFDYVAVLSEITRRRLVQKGVHEQKILPTSNPAFDSMVRERTGFEK